MRLAQLESGLPTGLVSADSETVVVVPEADCVVVVVVVGGGAGSGARGCTAGRAVCSGR